MILPIPPAPERAPSPQVVHAVEKLAELAQALEKPRDLLRERPLAREEDLRPAGARSSGIEAISPDAILSVDEDQRITMFNEGAEKIFGYSKAEAIGAPLEMLIPERFRALHHQHVERFAAGQGSARRMGERGAAIFGLRKNGEEFPADAAISKLDLNGRRILTVTLRDVTEQRRAEEGQRFLAEAGTVLASSIDYEVTLTSIARLAVRGIADLCLVDLVDDDGSLRRLRVISRDPSKAWACEILEKTPFDKTRAHLAWSILEAKQSMLLRELPPETVAAFSQSDELARALRALALHSIMAVPLMLGAKPLGIISFVSSTPTRVYGQSDLRLAEQLARLAALAIENARLYRAAQRAIQARDDVLGIVAHDLRNPLGSILLQTGLLRRRGSKPERRSRKPIEAIERAAGRMDRLIQDVLDVTRMEAGRLPIKQTRIPAGKILSDCARDQMPLASSATLELRLDAAAVLPDVLADRDRLLQVFENLIGNAVKFTRPGGRITIGAAAGQAEVLFRVEDTGAGIPPEDLPHVFDRFWQSGQAGRVGAGLGLPIAKGIVEAHGGRIWAESTPGSGSTFFFTIPTAPEADL